MLECITCYGVIVLTVLNLISVTVSHAIHQLNYKITDCVYIKVLKI